MKRALVLLLMLTLLICAAACGKAEDKEAEAGTAPEENEPAAVYTISDKVLVNNAECAFTITGVDSDNIWGPALNVLCRSKTDKELTFTVASASVNGYMIEPIWFISVPAQSSETSQILFESEQLDRCGIEALDEVEFILRIYDTDNMTAGNIVEDTFTVYPTGLSPEQITVPAKPAGANEYAAHSGDDFDFTVLETRTDSFWGYIVACYIDNKTASSLRLYADKVAVNGIETDPLWGVTVAAGKRDITYITLSETQLKENGVETDNIKEIEIFLTAVSGDDWIGEKIFEGSFIYRP